MNEKKSETYIASVVNNETMERKQRGFFFYLLYVYLLFVCVYLFVVVSKKKERKKDDLKALFSNILYSKGFFFVLMDMVDSLTARNFSAHILSVA